MPIALCDPLLARDNVQVNVVVVLSFSSLHLLQLKEKTLSIIFPILPKCLAGRCAYRPYSAIVKVNLHLLFLFRSAKIVIVLFTASVITHPSVFSPFEFVSRLWCLVEWWLSCSGTLLIVVHSIESLLIHLLFPLWGSHRWLQRYQNNSVCRAHQVEW